jgi:hypothetical protein
MQLALCWRPQRTGGGERRRGSRKAAATASLALQQPFPKALQSGYLRASEPDPVGTAPYLEESKTAPSPQVPEEGRGELSSPPPQGLGEACNSVQGLRPVAILSPPPAPSLALGLQSPPHPHGCTAHTGYKAPPTTRLAPPLSLERALLLPWWYILLT